jgi:hypothetical protein
VTLLSQTPIHGAPHRFALVNVPLLTAKFEEHQVILATDGDVEAARGVDLWGFEVAADDLSYIQAQMRLPVCVLCEGEEAIYIRGHHGSDEREISARIRSFLDFL